MSVAVSRRSTPLQWYKLQGKGYVTVGNHGEDSLEMLTVGSDKVQVRLNRGDLAPPGIPYFFCATSWNVSPCGLSATSRGAV